MNQRTTWSQYPKFVMTLCALVATAVLTTASVAAQAVAQAYTTDTTLQRGMIVRLSEKDKTKVEVLSTKSADQMEGVVVAANETPVTLSDSDRSKQQVFVATTGRYSVLVSTQNGPISANDYVTISALEGIGMRAGTERTLVVGKALTGFDGKTNVSGNMTLKDADGKDKTLAIGLIELDISITRNPGQAANKSLNIPGLAFLQAGATTLVGKQVDPARIYLSCLVMLLTAVVAGSILYAGVRNSLLAIGRNPLAKSSVIRNLIPVVLISIIILTLGVVGVYLLLKL